MTRKEIAKSPTMSMDRFLRTYYDMTEEMVVKLSSLSHRQLKEVASVYNIPLPRKSLNYTTKEDLLTGNVILVADRYGNPAPYKNPLTYILDDTDLEDPKIEGDDYSGQHKRR